MYMKYTSSEYTPFIFTLRNKNIRQLTSNFEISSQQLVLLAISSQQLVNLQYRTDTNFLFGQYTISKFSINYFSYYKVLFFIRNLNILSLDYYTCLLFKYVPTFVINVLTPTLNCTQNGSRKLRNYKIQKTYL